MTRVKMNAKHEYEFIANFKVLQNAFKAKKIDKVCPLVLCRATPLTSVQPILIEKLVKCKMQCVLVHPPHRCPDRDPGWAETTSNSCSG